jgi:hypothetical protein
MKCGGRVLYLELRSIRGFPLEEASEQEWIPSIKGSIVRCFPYLKGFDINKVDGISSILFLDILYVIFKQNLNKLF